MNSFEGVPFITVGQGELDEAPEVAAGDAIVCPRCNEAHVLADSEPAGLLWYHCAGNTYVGGVQGRLIGRFGVVYADADAERAGE